jgi:hypothetical protein
MSTVPGLATSFVSTLEPHATEPQKKSVADPFSDEPAGTTNAESRHDSSAHVIGSVHCDFVFGPVGPP